MINNVLIIGMSSKVRIAFFNFFTESLHSVILKQGVINAILHFAKSSDTSVQFWASALLLNLSMISDEIKDTIIRNGGMFILLEMAVSGDESDMPDIASNATKAMVILGFLGMYEQRFVFIIIILI